MRFVSHWPLGVPLLFLAYLPGLSKRGRCNMTFLDASNRPVLCTKLKGHKGRHRHHGPGDRRGGGWIRRSVFTNTKGRGMRSVTSMGRRLTAGACSSWSLRGRVSAVLRLPYRQSLLVRRVSSYTGPGLSTDVTATPGANGERRERAGSTKTLAPYNDWWDRFGYYGGPQ